MMPVTVPVVVGQSSSPIAVTPIQSVDTNTNEVMIITATASPFDNHQNPKSRTPNFDGISLDELSVFVLAVS